MYNVSVVILTDYFLFRSLCSWYNMAYNTTTASPDMHMHDDSGEPHLALRVSMGIIAVLSICGNGLLIVVLLRNRALLRSSYNVLILSLAVTDMTTGKVSILQKIFQCVVLKITVATLIYDLFW